jgi:hypothetical protein
MGYDDAEEKQSEVFSNDGIFVAVARSVCCPVDRRSFLPIVVRVSR